MFTFSKKIVSVSVASVLLSLSAGAMQQDQYQQAAQQCGKAPSLVLKPCPGTSISCEMNFDKTKYELVGHTTVDMTKETVYTCQLSQDLSDDFDSFQEFPVSKCSTDIDQIGKVRGKGTQCGETTTKILKKSEAVDYEGKKTSIVEVTRLQTAQLKFHGGDGLIVENKCGTMSAQEFFAHWQNRDAVEGFDLRALRDQIDAVIARDAISELKSNGGSITFQSTPSASCSSSSQSSAQQSSVGGKAAFPFNKKK